MKKVLFFAALLCGFVALNAQNQIGLLYNNQCYNNGDTVVVTLAPTAHNCDAIGFRNNTSGQIQNVVIEMTEIEANGLEAWGLCTGDQCVPTLTSAPFTLAPHQDYTTFTIDMTIDNVERPYGIYTLHIGTSLMSSDFVVRFNAYEETVGINPVSNATVAAYPNPAQGQVNINYSTDRPATLVIYNAMGQQVSSMQVNGMGAQQISLPAGLYTYGIAGSQMQKLIVK